MGSNQCVNKHVNIWWAAHCISSYSIGAIHIAEGRSSKRMIENLVRQDDCIAECIC